MTSVLLFSPSRTVRHCENGRIFSLIFDLLYYNIDFLFVNTV